MFTTQPQSAPEGRQWIVLGSANGSTNLGDECMWEIAAQVLREERGPVRIVTDGATGWRPPLEHVEVLPYLFHALRRGHGSPNAVVERALSLPGGWRRANAIARGEKAVGRRSRELMSRWQAAVSSSDGVLVSGAGALTDDFAVHGVASWYLITKWAKESGKPVYFVGQGVGPLTGVTRRDLAGRALRAADLVTVREPGSLSTVLDLGVPGTRVTLTPDWAHLNTPAVSDRERAAALHEELAAGEPFIAVSVHRRRSTTRSQARWLRVKLHELCGAAAQRGLRVVVVPNMTGDRYNDDRKTFDELSSSWIADFGTRVAVLRTRERSRVVRAFVGRSQGMVSTRYHPIIFALSEGIGAAGLSYDPYYDQKLNGCFETFGVKPVVLGVGDSSPASLIVDAISTMSPRTRESLSPDYITEALRRALAQSGPLHSTPEH